MKWVGKFGFGQDDRRRLPRRERRRRADLPDQWSGSTIGNVPIGQGIAVTSIQMAAAYAAVANSGVWVQPHLIDAHRRATGAPSSAAGSSRPAIDDELKAMLHGRRGRARRDRDEARSPATGSRERRAPRRARGYTG